MSYDALKPKCTLSARKTKTATTTSTLWLYCYNVINPQIVTEESFSLPARINKQHHMHLLQEMLHISVSVIILNTLYALFIVSSYVK